LSLSQSHKNHSHTVNREVPPQWVIEDKHLNLLLQQVIKQQNGDLPADPDKIKDWHPGEKEYYFAIWGMVGAMLGFTASEIRKHDYSTLSRRDFMTLLDPQLNKILHSTGKTADKMMEQFYRAGKQFGFSQMHVDAFFGLADKHALFYIKQYNFGLIKQLSDDMRGGIKEEIWRGVARGDSIPTIARNIRELGLKPIQAGNRMLSPQARSILISRTETIRAMAQGHVVAFQQYGVGYVDVVTAGDERVCDECAPAEAEGPYPIDDIPVDAQIPIHPDCRCVYAAAERPADTPQDIQQYFNLVDGETVTATEI
jgi:SPP1 gp7 family putative phage head morphogenesis protein